MRTTKRAAVLAIAISLATLPAMAGKPLPPRDWQEVTPAASVTGVDGQSYSPSCSALPGTDPSFRFWHRPGRSDKLVVYFEGGGACWDDLTCSFPIGSGLPSPAPQFYVPAISPGSTPAGIGGMFDTTRADNPVRDWNLVYIPYCSGDIHTGSTTKNYFNAGNPYLPAQYEIRHRGFDNFMAVLAWMKSELPKPNQILVTGVSAGGYGATANFPWVERSYGSARVSLLADASQGVTTEAFDNGPVGRNSWNPQLAPWVFGAAPTMLPGNQLMRAVALAHPRSKVAQFTTALDEVQIGFYGVMKQFYGPGGSCPNPAVDWNQQMLAALSADAGLPNYRHYLAAGSYHTLLRDDNYYGEASAGVPFAGWLGQMLANQGGTGGAGGKWFDAACPGCLTPLPCE